MLRALMTQVRRQEDHIQCKSLKSRRPVIAVWNRLLNLPTHSLSSFILCCGSNYYFYQRESTSYYYFIRTENTSNTVSILMNIHRSKCALLQYHWLHLEYENIWKKIWKEGKMNFGNEY